ncbi:hypothetical protein HHE02_09670 [Helicobacter heilmannii]|nr:hypothetical protein HHE02_09670 [Helicobacter heilmannii]
MVPSPNSIQDHPLTQIKRMVTLVAKTPCVQCVVFLACGKTTFRHMAAQKSNISPDAPYTPPFGRVGLINFLKAPCTPNNPYRLSYLKGQRRLWLCEQ